MDDGRSIDSLIEYDEKLVAEMAQAGLRIDQLKVEGFLLASKTGPADPRVRVIEERLLQAVLAYMEIEKAERAVQDEIIALWTA